MLGSEILLGDWTLALKKRNRAGEMAQPVGVLAAKPVTGFPKTCTVEETSFRKLASDLHVDMPTQSHMGGRVLWHLQTWRDPTTQQGGTISGGHLGVVTDRTGFAVKHGDPHPQLQTRVKPLETQVCVKL